MCGGVGSVAAVAGREVQEEQHYGSSQSSPRSFPKGENKEECSFSRSLFEKKSFK